MHNKWILTLHRQLAPSRAASISELNKDLQQQQQQQQLDSPNEPIGLDKRNTSYNNIDGYNDKDYENELNGELDNNLNAYSPHGAYGRQAFEFFTSKASANNLQVVSNEAEISPEVLKLEAGKLNQRFKLQWKRQRRLNVRSAPGKLNNSHLRVSSKAFSSEYDHQGDNLNEPKPSSLLDWSSIYRDQVYRFDGLSKAVVIPKTIYSSSSPSSSSSYQQSFILNDQAKNKINVNENAAENETPPDIPNPKHHREQFIFGSKHTISFWMRHASFKFPPSTSEILSLELTNTNQTKPNNHYSNHEKFHQSSASMNMSKDELDELAKHVKEHIICGSLDSFETPKHPNFTSSSSTTTPTKQKPNQDYHQQHRLNYKHHHYYYALFVRNCKLVLLMRRHLNESRLNDAKNYQPTEWRWSFDTSQSPRSSGSKSPSKSIICDHKWHLYTINVNYPIVELYIDGQQFEENYNNLVIVDDLPLPENANHKHLNGSSSFDANNYNNKKSETEISDNIVLSVGACLDSRRQTWSGHFKGSLSGLSVLMNENDDSNTIECLGKCSEALVSTANSANSLPMQDQQEATSTSKVELPDSLPSSTSKLDNSLISYQESQSKILLNGHDFIDVEDALSQIAYKNNRPLPSIGKRSIIVETNIECHHHHQSQSQSQPQHQFQHTTTNYLEQASQAQHGTFNIPIDPVKVEVSVLPSKNLPVIFINGITSMAREYSPFINGINLFSSINIHIKQIDLQSAQDLSKFTSLKQQSKNPEFHINMSQSAKKSAQEHEVTTSQYADYIEDSNLSNHQSQQQQVVELIEPNLIKHRIEACSINVDPPLNGSYESLLLPIDKMNSLHLYWRESQNGAVIYGVDSVDNYQSILRSMVYRNQEPAYYLERIFKLICSDMNGRLVSNEYSQTLSIIHLNKRTAREEISGAQSEMSATKFSNLRMSSLHTLNEQTPVVDEPYKFNAKRHYDIHQHQQGQQQPSLNLLNLEQTTKLDRIAIAFLVFVISLIVIMIIIALTNLKEPSLKNSSFENSYGSNTNKQLIYGSDQALSYDIDSAQNGCYYGDELMIDDLDESGDEDADEEDDDYNEEEREEEQQVGNVREHKTRKEAERRMMNNEKLPSRYMNSDLHFNQTDCFKNSQIKLRKFHTQTSMESSSTNTGLESLAWDDEALNDDYTIVMNPMIHGIKIKNYRSNKAQEGEIMRTSVTEQRLNKSGSITQKPQTHLSYHSPILTGACSSQTNQDYELEFDEDAASTSSEMGDFRAQSPNNQCHSPSNSRSNLDSSSSSSSGSGSGSCSSDEDIHMNTCKHHRHNDVDDDDNELSVSSGQYEIYHAHQHHFHHTCLKQLDCSNTSSQDSDELSTDTTESADEFIEELGERQEENVARLQDHHESYNPARSNGRQYVRRRARNNSEAQHEASEMNTRNECQSQNRPTFQPNFNLINESDGDNDYASNFNENTTSISWIPSRDDESSGNSIPSMTAALTYDSISSNSEKSVASLTSPSRNDLN